MIRLSLIRVVVHMEAMDFVNPGIYDAFVSVQDSRKCSLQMFSRHVALCLEFEDKPISGYWS